MLTRVDDVLAGWEWNAIATPHGYAIQVLDSEGQEWVRSYTSDKGPYRPADEAYGSGINTTMTKEVFTAERRKEVYSFKQRKVGKQADKLLREVVAAYLRYNVNPKERPQFGVKYIGSQ